MNAMPRTDRSVNPREKFLGVKLVDYNKDCRAAYGEYVQATVIPNQMAKNTKEGRTVAAIALLPTMNGNGTYWFYDLKTKNQFTAKQWTSLPMPDIVIEQLNQLYNIDYPLVKGKSKRRNRRKTQQPHDA
jgi:hypothetical protein